MLIDDIDISPIQPLKVKCAFDCFRAWQELYDENFSIINEQILVNDFAMSIRKALLSLLTGEDFSHKSTYDFIVNHGFIQGFLSSNLANHWHLQYIAPQKQNFQATQSLRAIIDYLKFDEISNIRHKTIFEKLLKSKIKNLDFDSVTLYDNIDLLEKIMDKTIDKYSLDAEVKYVPTEIISKYINSSISEKLIKINLPLLING